MLDDHFKEQYTTLPVATFYGAYERSNISHTIRTLRHNHRELELLAVNKGRATFLTGTDSLEINEGDIIIISPYVLHNFIIDKETDFEHFCICFDSKILPDTQLSKNFENGIIHPKPIIKSHEKFTSSLFNLLKSAFDAQRSKPVGWELTVIGNLSLFFSTLLKEGKISKKLFASNEADISRDIMAFIEKNYASPITSSHAAEAMHVSKSYFCRVFKSNFGNCFQNYLCMFRLEKSKILLKTTNLSISEISTRVGFNSFSFFSKMFREYFGYTPSEYRQLT